MNSIILPKGTILKHQRYFFFPKGIAFPYLYVNYFSEQSYWEQEGIQRKADYIEYTYITTKNIELLDLSNVEKLNKINNYIIENIPDIKEFFEVDVEEPEQDYRINQICMYIFNYEGTYSDGICLADNCKNFLILSNVKVYGKPPFWKDVYKKTDYLDTRFGNKLKLLSHNFLWNDEQLYIIKKLYEQDRVMDDNDNDILKITAINKIFG